LQIGRDIYADTRLIARIIDDTHPEPALIPRAHAASVTALESWADQQLFLAAIPVMFRPAGRAVLEKNLGADYLARFQADRAELFAQGSVGRPDDQFSRAVYEPTLANLESQLADRDFLLGDTPTLADFSLYHPVWYVANNPGVASILDMFPGVLAWAARIKQIGHGTPKPLEPTDALRAAEQAQGFVSFEARVDLATGFEAGSAVCVAARDYGTDTVAGRLIHMDNQRVVIERDVDTLGAIRNHYPRQGFEVRPA